MEWGPITIEKYVLISGECPFDDWANKLSQQDRAAVHSRLDRVTLGNFGDSRSLGAGVYELKFKSGAGFRIYYGRAGKRVILLLSAGDKRTQKRDITTAKRYWRCFQKEK